MSRRVKTRKRPEAEFLEPRLVLAGSTLSINSVTITLNPSGPTSVAGALSPGNQLAAYRIDGVTKTLSERSS